MIRATGEAASSPLVALPEVKRVFISSVPRHVSAKDIADHVKNTLKVHWKVLKIRPNSELPYASFCVEVVKDIDLMLADKWPKGTLLKVFRGRLKEEQTAEICQYPAVKTVHAAHVENKDDGKRSRNSDAIRKSSEKDSQPVYSW